MGEAQFFGDGR